MFNSPLQPHYCKTAVSRWPFSQTKIKMEQEKNCAFQYAKMREGIFRDTKIVEDKSELTLDEAKKLWNKHFADAAKWIKDGNTVEMVIWINMATPQSYGDTLQYISTDAEMPARIEIPAKNIKIIRAKKPKDAKNK